MHIKLILIDVSDKEGDVSVRVVLDGTHANLMASTC